mgnify:CR=1 FL=1
MVSEALYGVLLSYQDIAYRDMQRRLTPTVDPETILGVRTPALRQLARELEDGEAFRQKLPHRYFEENQIHAFLLEREKDFDKTVQAVEAFLPYVDNWATCDQLRPRAFRDHERLLPLISKWLASTEPYTVRFGLGMLMCHFLDGDFQPEFLELAVSVKSDEYYVKMMVAWYFATALAKQYEATLPYITEHRLEPWTHNRTIQKAVESFRVPPEHKEFLKSCRVKA